MNDQEFIDIELDKVPEVSSLLYNKILVIGLEQEASTELLEKILKEHLNDKNGNVCTNALNMQKYDYINPEKLYKGYNKLFNERYFQDENYLIFDNIELGLQQCYQVCDMLADKKMFFINCRKTVMNADPVIYDYIFLYDYSVKIYNKYFKDVVEEFEYFEYLNVTLNNEKCILIYNTKEQKFMYTKKID